MKELALVFWVVVFGILFSCGSEVDTKTIETEETDSVKQIFSPKISRDEAVVIEPEVDDEVVELESNGIKLIELKSLPSKGVSLGLSTKQFKEGVNDLSYAIEGISEFNIATIENNYTINYFSQKEIKKEFLYGNNVFLSFLTGVNKISVKTNRANVLKNVVIGDMESLFDMKQPHLFYHLPQENTSSPILDFYLINTSINDEGSKVKVTINKTEFIIYKWAAYQIEGLNKENNTIRIQLIDKNGDVVEGPFNDSGDRVFHLNSAS